MGGRGDRVRAYSYIIHHYGLEAEESVHACDGK